MLRLALCPQSLAAPLSNFPTFLALCSSAPSTSPKLTIEGLSFERVGKEGESTRGEKREEESE